MPKSIHIIDTASTYKARLEVDEGQEIVQLPGPGMNNGTGNYRAAHVERSIDVP